MPRSTSDKPICHFNLAPHYRGGERQTELLVRALSKRGLAQRLVIKRGNSLADRCSDIERLEIREVASNPVAAGIAARGSRVTHAHDGRTVYSGLTANVFFGIPYIVTRRVVAPQSKKALRVWAYRRAARLVAISNAVVDAMRIQHPDITADIVPDASAGFDFNENAAQKIRAIRAGKILIGHVGALDHSHKGQSTIIEAARMAADEHPDWHFLLCGDGKHEQRFRDEIGDLPNIELVGWVDNVGDYLASFDLFVYPSLHEGLGSTLLDAFEFGLPVVASNVGGIPEYVEEAVNGRLIEPENPRQMVSAIDSILADKIEMQEIGHRNRLKAQSFSADRMAATYLAMYETL